MVRQRKKQMNWDFAWTRNGSIYVRKNKVLFKWVDPTKKLWETEIRDKKGIPKPKYYTLYDAQDPWHALHKSQKERPVKAPS